MPRLLPTRLVLGLAAILAAGGLQVAPAAAAQPAAAVDPARSAHRADELAHASQPLNLTPATSSPLPLQRPRVQVAAGAAAAAATPNAGPQSQDSIVGREIFGFAPYWSLALESTWNYSLLSTVAYFGLDMQGNGGIDTSTGGWQGWNSSQLVDMINRAHAAGDRVVVVVKQFDAGGVNQIVTDQIATRDAINNIINAIASRNLDGVNVDFEGSSVGYPQVQAGMVNFMSQLSQQVHARWSAAEVTIDTYSGSAYSDGGIFNIPQLAPVVDAFFVMSYDEIFGDVTNRAGANAPLQDAPPYQPYNDTRIVREYLGRAPAYKVILGVPYYGYKWSTINNGLNAPTTSGAVADSFSDALSDLQCAQSHGLQFTRDWDPPASSPWISWFSPGSGDPCGGNHNSWRELYFDDAGSLGFKYDLVISNNLRGTGMWALGYDGGNPDLWNELALKFSVIPVWYSLAGTATSGPAVTSWAANRRDVFVRGTDAQLWHRWYDGVSWSAWEPLGGVIANGTSPAAVSWAANRIDVVVAGTDGGAWHKWWDGLGWNGWENLSGTLTSSPALSSWAPNRLDIFTRGTDSALWHRWWDGTSWSGWESQGGMLTSGPGAASWGLGRVDVFVRGTDNGMWHRWYEAGWSGWEPLGGTLTSAPAASSWGPGRLDLLVQTAGGSPWHRYFYRGQWSSWVSLGGTGTADPAVVDRGYAAVDGYVRGTDAAIWFAAVPP